MPPFRSLLAAILMVPALMSQPAGAEGVLAQPESAAIEADAGGAFAAAPQVTAATGLVDVTLDGETLSLRVRGLGSPEPEFDAAPLFAALKSRYELRGSILGYWRYQDGAVIGLDFSDGKVRANGALLGALPDLRPRDEADTWLTPNAIAVLTGTRVSEDGLGNWHFELDPRLRPQYDLELWVDGRPARVNPGLEPRTIGPVLLIPLMPVAEALGHRVQSDPVAGRVRLVRVHDSAVIELELASGLVTVNGAPSGVSPNIAYADPRNLLLPSTAVETLTGANIRLRPGSNRIDVTLDARLSSLALPGERVDDEAARTPFTPERLDFQLSDRGPLSFELYSRVNRYNTVATLETVGGLDDTRLLTPRWMSVDVQAMEGWQGSLGDYNGRFRETAGTDTARLRGAAYRRQLNSGTLMAIAAGVPLTGAKPVGNGASQPEFAGFAGGVRFIDPGGDAEYGVALATGDRGPTRLVAGGRREVAFGPGAPLGIESASLIADIGAFEAAGAADLDLRARGEARFRLAENAFVQTILSHDGAAFADASGVEETGDRTAGTAALSWFAREAAGPFNHLAGGLRAGWVRTGGPAASDSYSLSGAVNTRIGRAGPDLSATLSQTRTETGGVAFDQAAFAARLFQSFDWGALTASYSAEEDETGHIRQRILGSAILPGWKRSFSNSASLSLGPTVSGVWTPDSTRAALGANLSGDSGLAFGDRFRLRGQVSALNAFDESENASRFFGNLVGSLRLTRSVQLQGVFSTDFDSRTDLSVALRGTLHFNEPRRHTAPKTGTGVLKGRAFYDRNRDGIRQPDEPGIPGVSLRLAGTPLALTADNSGHYTIQNLKTGLYEIQIDKRSLPLGLMIGGEYSARATVGEGRITTLDIPVIASGQVRGALFVDENANGQLDRGERRLEGEWVHLVPQDGGESASILTASFGQFGFEQLAPGQYTLRVHAAGEHVEVAFEISEEDLFAEINLPIPIHVPEEPERTTLLAAP